MVLRLILHTISINNSNIIPNKPCNLFINTLLRVRLVAPSSACGGRKCGHIQTNICKTNGRFNQVCNKNCQNQRNKQKYTQRKANILASPNYSNTKNQGEIITMLPIPDRFPHGHTTLVGYHNMPSASQIWPKLVGEYKTQINKKARSLPGRRHFFLFPLNIRWIPGKFTRTCKKKIIIKKIKNRD